LPLSALSGDNVVNLSSLMPWYSGKTLMELLNSVELSSHYDATLPFRFPVQYVNRPNLNFRGYCGTIASGNVKVGDEITVLPSGKSTRIKSIIPPSIGTSNNKVFKSIDEAYAPMAITLTTEDEIDISRGDMIVHSKHLPRVSNSLKVMLVWMDETPMVLHHTYSVKSSTATVNGTFEHINYKVDINTYEKNKVQELFLNDIGSCKLVLNRPIAVDPYRANRSTGSFIVMDRLTNNTVAAGMIVDVSRRDSENLTSDHCYYTKEEIDLNGYIRKNFPEWGCKAI
jgi:sulfate adenylyltransferase subunit 1